MDLEIGQHERFQQLEWRAERTGWVLIALFVVAGLLGGLGTGVLSWRTASTGAVTVAYDRVTHHEADDSLTVTFTEAAVEDGTVTAELTGSWPSAVDIDAISPEPAAQLLTPGGLVLEFDVERPGELTVVVSFRAHRHGAQDGRLTVGADTVAFSQFVMP